MKTKNANFQIGIRNAYKVNGYIGIMIGATIMLAVGLIGIGRNQMWISPKEFCDSLEECAEKVVEETAK